MIFGMDELILAEIALAVVVGYYAFQITLGQKGMKPFVLILLGIGLWVFGTTASCGGNPTCGWDWSNPAGWIGWLGCNLGSVASGITLGNMCMMVKAGMLALSFLAFLFAIIGVFL